MAMIYKIHPATGFARLGTSDAFFIGPERPGDAGVELNGAAETPVATYKSAGQLKKQGARFRVFEYSEGNGGALTLVREITAAEARIRWTVTLVNSKAAGKKIVPDTVGTRQVMVPGRWTGTTVSRARTSSSTEARVTLRPVIPSRPSTTVGFSAGRCPSDGWRWIRRDA